MVIYTDTNVIVRLITGDDQEQRRLAVAAVNRYGSAEVFVSDVVLAELFYVLASPRQYAMSRIDICGALDGLLGTPQFSISPEARAALMIAAGNKKLDFTDCLLSVYANGQKKKLLSFDQDLIKLMK